MGKKLGFKSCAKGGEFTEFGKVIPTTYDYIYVEKPANIDSYIKSQYDSDPNLKDKVGGIGYGWQKYVAENSGMFTFTVRGAAGGSYGYSDMVVDPTTGEITTRYPDRCKTGGRGAKIVGKCMIHKDDVLYMLVGMRGWSNAYSSDYGAGGGGASVVLRANPSGTYTFDPTMEKVDVLFVAGGGGGCGDNNTNYPEGLGRDAVYTDGLNTNGGVSHSCSGGAGLTGDPTGSGYYEPYSILSGKPGYTSDGHTIHYGGWGGRRRLL